MFSEIKLSEPYIAYFYGPFNKEVAKSLEKMVVFNMLEERTITGKHEGYLYKVSDKGIPMVDKLLKDFKHSFVKIEELVNTCYEHCKLDPNILSFAAKTHYILYSDKRIKKMNYNNLVEIANKFGWKVSKSDIRQGADLLEKLKLVQLT